MRPALPAGKRAVVTGAASGIGRATALICAREGASVGVLDVNASAANAPVSEITSAAGTPVALEADVRRESDVESAIKRLRERRGGLDVVIGCAGVQLAGEHDWADAYGWRSGNTHWASVSPACS